MSVHQHTDARYRCGAYAACAANQTRPYRHWCNSDNQAHQRGVRRSVLLLYLMPDPPGSPAYLLGGTFLVFAPAWDSIILLRIHFLTPKFPDSLHHSMVHSARAHPAYSERFHNGWRGCCLQVFSGRICSISRTKICIGVNIFNNSY